MFYKVHYAKVPLKELLREGQWYAKPFILIIALVVKVFRIRIPYSMDVPPVESLSDFRVTAEDLDADLLDTLTLEDQRLHDLGFSRTELLGINDMTQNTRYGMAVFRSADGDMIAWIRSSVSPLLAKHLRFTRVAFYSLGPSGDVVLTTSADHDLADPPHWQVQYHTKMPADQLLEQHRAHSMSVLGNARPMKVNEDAAALDLLEHTHQEFIEFQRERGVFVATTISARSGRLRSASAASDDSTAAAFTDTADTPDANPFVIPGQSNRDPIGLAATETMVDADASDGTPPFQSTVAMGDEETEAIPIAEIIPEGRPDNRPDNAVVNPFAATPSLASHSPDLAAQVPLAEATLAQATLAEATLGVYEIPDHRRAELEPIIDAVREKETKQSGWLANLAFLGISIAFFVGLGAWRWDLNLVLMLVPILLVHELGHFAAMKLFGYRNVRMFFIPLLGAAVSGRHYRVDGWKKAMVSLAGPLPSIVLGIGLGIAGSWYGNETIMHASMLTIFINLANLLPFLPLDGGWIAHLTLFSRSNVLDLIVRVIAALLLAVGGGLLGDNILMFLGILMFISLPTVWKTMKATEMVRQHQLPEPSDDEMPEVAIAAVVDAIQSSNIHTTGAKPLANMTLQVYENVMVSPPSWPATLGIWALYFGGIVTGIIGMFVVTIGTWGGLLNMEDYPDYESQFQEITMEDGDFRLKQDSPTDEDESDDESQQENADRDMMAWRFPNTESAKNAFAHLKETEDQSIARLDTMVFATQETDQSSLKQARDLEDPFERARLTEIAANDDQRLDVVSGETWRRAFLGSGPQLLFVTDHATAEDLVAQSESIPYAVGRSQPISPWTPKLKLTDQQVRLQKTLRLLQGSETEVPWKVEQNTETIEALDFSSKKLEASMKRMTELAERNRQHRFDWIQAESESTTGVEQQLLKAYVEHETETEQWRNDERSYDEKGPAPRLDKILRALLPDLGFVTPDHPLARTSTSVEMYVMDEESVEYEYGEEFPIPFDGKAVVEVYLSPTKDVAAAFACVHAWLKKEGIRSIVWLYSTPVPTEEE